MPEEPPYSGTLKELLTSPAFYSRIAKPLRTRDLIGAMSKASPDNVEVTSIFGAAKAGLRTPILASLTLAALTYLALTLYAPRYQSETELAVVAESASSAADIHMRALRSSEILKTVAGKLALNKKPEFNPALGPVDQVSAVLRMTGFEPSPSGDSEADRVLSTLRNQLEIFPAKKSRIGVRMTSVDAELAASIANTVAETYRASLEKKFDDQQKLINGKIDKLTNELAVIDAETDRTRREIDNLKSRDETAGLDAQSPVGLQPEIASLASEEAKLHHLEADAKPKRTEIEMLRTDLEASRKSAVAVKVVATARAADVPAFPEKTALSAIVGIAALIFGIALAVLKSLVFGARKVATTAVPKSEPAPARKEPVLSPATHGLQRNSAPPQASQAASVAAASAALSPETQTMTDIAGIADYLAAKRLPQGGHRTLITGDGAATGYALDALGLARTIAEKSASVVLVNWSTTGQGIEAEAGIPAGPGLIELLTGEIKFDEAVRRLPHGNVHFIGCGAPLETTKAEIDPDLLNLILDALDEAYDHIVVVGAHDDARLLFEVIQGRFDAGITIVDKKRRVPVLEDPAGSFLGFEVTDFDIIRYERDAAQARSREPMASAPYRSTVEPRRRVS